MQIRTRSIRGVAVVAPAGSLDAAGARELLAAISALVDEGGRWIVIYLARVEHVTGTSIGALLAIRRKIEAQMGGMILCGMSESVKRAFDLVGIAGRFRIVGSPRSGIRALCQERETKELADRVAALLIAAEDRHAAKTASK